jgi:hypothetical protein
MYQVKNNRRAQEAVDSSRFRSPRHYRRPLRRGRRSLTCTAFAPRLWVPAEIAVKYADHNPLLIDQATKTLENALRREGMPD